MKFFSQERQVG